jgi:hypothetical protein
MKLPPPRYRLVSPNLSISGPLREKSIAFLHDSGCRKLITLPGGFVNSDVVVALKRRRMEVEHFPVEVHLSETVYDEQIQRVLHRIVSALKKGSRIHLVCGPEMIEAACIIGILRQSFDEWSVSGALTEALDVCRFADADRVIDIVSSCSRDLNA